MLIRHRDQRDDPTDFHAMIASNLVMASMLATADDAAVDVIEAVLADEPCVITHGDLTAALAARAAKLTRAAEFARDPQGGGT